MHEMHLLEQMMHFITERMQDLACHLHFPIDHDVSDTPLADVLKHACAAAGVPTTITAGTQAPYVPLQTADPTPQTGVNAIPEPQTAASTNSSPTEWWQVPPPPPPAPPADGLAASPGAGDAALAAEAPRSGAEWWQVPPPPPPSPPGAIAPQEVSRAVVLQAAAGPAVTPSAVSGPEFWQVPPPPPPSPPAGAQAPAVPADALAAQSPAQPEAAAEPADSAAAPSADWWKVPPPPPPSPPAEGGIAPGKVARMPRNASLGLSACLSNAQRVHF